jgi:RNAse (barnase) inhibitor barstar
MQDAKFSEFYGFSFDAFWDCITDDAQSIVTNTLNVVGVSELASNLPREAKLLEKSLLDYQKERNTHLTLA